MPYRYTVYNMQDQAHSVSSHDAIDALEADGWEIHTANCNFAELCVLWHKPVQGKRRGRHEESPE